jgi:hypothetical protein
VFQHNVATSTFISFGGITLVSQNSGEKQKQKRNFPTRYPSEITHLEQI